MTSGACCLVCMMLLLRCCNTAFHCCRRATQAVGHCSRDPSTPGSWGPRSFSRDRSACATQPPQDCWALVFGVSCLLLKYYRAWAGPWAFSARHADPTLELQKTHEELGHGSDQTAASDVGDPWRNAAGIPPSSRLIGGFPKIRGTLLGVPRIRTIVFGVYIGVPLFWETTIESSILSTPPMMPPKSPYTSRVPSQPPLAPSSFCTLHISQGSAGTLNP